ncbi:hypothetical protein C8J57DRAFT_1523897 [Mycena rebaudengoi]|nr:hypothetical protein C8J57DRAFT_1523897 [Mycena rebaudengoi]
MPPLTRQQTLESLRSWWSDSTPNLHGPTINIHTAAKPLMKLLYNRQASEFISTNRDIPLSAMGWDIYGSYLSCKYVSASTKSSILKDILWRARSEHDTLVVHTHIFHDILKLLEGPITVDMRMWDAHSILLRLAKHDATAAATCGSLVVDGVLSVLSSVDHIKFPPVTSGVSVEAKLLDRLSDMFEDSFTPELHYRWISEVVSKLARHESTAVAVVEANILNSVEKLLKSFPAGLYESIFPILENLASHEATAMAVVRMLRLDLLGALWRKHFKDTALIDVLASWLEVLVTTKLLSAQHEATAKATSSSLVAIFCDRNIPQVVDGTLWLLSRVLHIKLVQ